MLIALALAAQLAASTAAAPADAPEDPQARLAGLQQLYAESCGSRGYGAYDDICNQLQAQLHQAEVEAARAARKPKPAAAPKPAKAVAGPAGTD